MRPASGGWSCTSTARTKAGPRPITPGEVPPRHALRSTPELACGLGHGWEVGLYLPSLLDANGHFEVAGLKVRLKCLPWLPVDRLGGFGGVNLELSRLAHRYSQSRWSTEARFIVGWRSRDWLLVANPTLDFDLSDGLRGQRPEFNLGLKLAGRLADGLAARPGGLQRQRPAGPAPALAAAGQPGLTWRWTWTTSPGSSTSGWAAA